MWVMEDVKGGFNNVLGQEVLDVVARSKKRGWGRWLRDFFRPWQFEVEWDGKVRGQGSANVGVLQGSANVGVLQGSPLSPVVFLIWMALILRRMEERVKAGTGLDVELPSFVDDMCFDTVDWEGVSNMQRVEADIKRIVRKVAEENHLPLEAEKEEVLHLRKTRKKRNVDRKHVKWLGVIFDDSLDFDVYWKSRIAKARKALRALSGVGGLQWGMCPRGWKKAYEGMIRSIAMWRAELGWRGQKNWEKKFSRLQYQALRKATGAVLGTAAEKVNWMAGVEDVDIHLDNNQVRFVARQVENPTKLGDLLPVGFGDIGGGVVDDELAEEREGRKWNDHGPQWVAKEGKKDGFVSTLTWMVSILPEGKPLFGGPCQKVEIEEVEVRPVDDRAPGTQGRGKKKLGKRG